MQLYCNYILKYWWVVKCNYIAYYATIWNYIATYATILQLYATILQQFRMQLYATILQQFRMQLYANMQLYATMKLYATMQLIIFFSDNMQLYATLCNNETYVTIWNFMEQCNLCNYMKLYCNYMQLCWYHKCILAR